MKVQRIFAAVLAVAMIMTCVSLPSFAAGEDYGTTSVGADG